MVIVFACFYLVDAFIIIVESCRRGFQVQCLVVNHSERRRIHIVGGSSIQASKQQCMARLTRNVLCDRINYKSNLSILIKHHSTTIDITNHG